MRKFCLCPRLNPQHCDLNAAPEITLHALGMESVSPRVLIVGTTPQPLCYRAILNYKTLFSGKVTRSPRLVDFLGILYHLNPKSLLL